MRKAIVGGLAVAFALFVSDHASAQQPGGAEARPTLNVRAAPVFGTEAAVGEGWSEIAVSLDNVGGSAKKGTIDLVATLPYGRSEAGATTRAPFNVAPGRTVVVKLPTHGFPYQAATWSLTVTDESGGVIAKVPVPANGNPAPLLVDVDQPSRLSVAMRSWPVMTTWSPYGYTYGYAAPGTRPPMTVGSPTFDRTTGDPILPDRAAGYGPVTVLLMHTDTLAKLEAQTVDALVSWVISGGTLALVPSRPEDLRGGTVAALVGGAVSPAPPPPIMMTLPAQEKPSGSGLFPTDPLNDPLDDAPPPPGTAPLKFEPKGGGAGSDFIPIRTSAPHWPRVGPTPEVREKLQGFSGGNLVPSVYGASAAYGTGEVHLLAFDPTQSPLVDDAWVQSRIVDLVGHAWDRRAINVVTNGGAERSSARIDDVRRVLDPNENFRGALGIAAILLVIYSILAGPVTFLRAAKKGKPLAPLKWAPIWSAATFGAIVLVGLAGKGWRGRARHYALVETGAGVTRGAVRRFRGFFTSESRTLSVASTDSGSVLRIATNDASAADLSDLRMDRNGGTLENITSLPWQTIVVREDGTMDMKGAVTVLGASDGSVDVTNHTGRTLKNALVSVPGDAIRYFPSIKDGEKVHAADGRVAVGHLSRRSSAAGAMTVHPLGSSSISAGIGGKVGDEVMKLWQPIETAMGESVDWWPDTTPVLMAELDGGEGVKNDSGLRVENDQLLLRVVGRGGAP